MGALDGLVRVSQGLHQTFGTNATLRRVARGAYDPATLSSAETETDETVKVVFGKFRADEIAGPIEMGDVKCSLYVTTPPLVGDRVVIGSDVYAIVYVSSQYATDEVAYYDVALRR